MHEDLLQARHFDLGFLERVLYCRQLNDLAIFLLRKERLFNRFQIYNLRAVCLFLSFQQVWSPFALLCLLVNMNDFHILIVHPRVVPFPFQVINGIPGSFEDFLFEFLSDSSLSASTITRGAVSTANLCVMGDVVFHANTSIKITIRTCNT